MIIDNYKDDNSCVPATIRKIKPQPIISGKEGSQIPSSILNGIKSVPLISAFHALQTNNLAEIDDGGSYSLPE